MSPAMAVAVIETTAASLAPAMRLHLIEEAALLGLL
jgi:hypothetical protein